MLDLLLRFLGRTRWLNRLLRSPRSFVSSGLPPVCGVDRRGRIGAPVVRRTDRRSKGDIGRGLDSPCFANGALASGNGSAWAPAAVVRRDRRATLSFSATVVEIAALVASSSIGW